jgi:hypothetical protein
MAVETALSMKALYDQDFVLWASKTAELLKLKKFDEVDWENLIEEVECMGKSDRRAVESLLTQLIEHLFKLAYHKSERERERNVCHWVGEIASFRTQLGEWLETTTLSQPCAGLFSKSRLERSKNPNTSENRPWRRDFSRASFLPRTGKGSFNYQGRSFFGEERH